LKTHELHEELKTWLAGKQRHAQACADETWDITLAAHRQAVADAYQAVITKIADLEDRYE
jgi:hypothetical protein